MVEEHDTFDELFNEPQFEEEKKEFYDHYAVNPTLDFPRPMVTSRRDSSLSFSNVCSSTVFFIAQYESSVNDEKSSMKPVEKMKGREDRPRVQDVELQKMSDPGKCLSMHQPYASLLVTGIKK